MQLATPAARPTACRPPRPHARRASPAVRRPPAPLPTRSRRTRASAQPPAGAQPTTKPSPTTLSEAESTARAAFQASAGSDPGEAAVRTLRRAAMTRDADGDAVLGALAHALTAPAPLPGARPASPAFLSSGGPWRLVFSNPAPTPAWRYIPVPEFFAVPPGPVSLSSDVGPLHFCFSGTGEWRAEGEGKEGGKNAALDFAFARVDVQWGRDAAGPFFTRALGPRPPKTYTFFACLPGGGGDGSGGYSGSESGSGVDVVCARSSGGALSLLARPASGGAGR
jgi:hypothetical protein